jgi:hypothetical protein
MNVVNVAGQSPQRKRQIIFKYKLVGRIKIKAQVVAAYRIVKI